MRKHDQTYAKNQQTYGTKTENKIYMQKKETHILCENINEINLNWIPSFICTVETGGGGGLD